MFFQVLSEAGILALQIPLTVGNQCPGNDAARRSKRCSDEEDGLRALECVGEGVLDGCEDFCADRSPSLPNGGSEAQEMTSQRCREGPIDDLRINLELMKDNQNRALTPHRRER
jgi:hypothetical protein